MATDRLIDTQIGHHTIVRLIGRGRMGSVYLAEHQVIGRQVAVKVLHPELTADEEMAARFMREARISARIQHGNIVQMMDFGSLADGTLYLVMEYVPGGTLRELLQEKGRLPLIRAINIVHQVARALAAAHREGIVHRDIKPANILVERRQGRRDLVYVPIDPAAPMQLMREEEFEFVKVCDFGIARLLAGTGRRLTRAGETMGTPDYIAPELLGGADLTPLADVYSLGVIFYQLSTGRLPFAGCSALEAFRRVTTETAPSPGQTVPEADLTDAAEDLIMRAIHRDPRRRPASMDAFTTELQHCYGQVIYRRKLSEIALPPLSDEPSEAAVDEQLDWTAADAVQELLDEQSTMIIDRTVDAASFDLGSGRSPGVEAASSGEPTLILPLRPPPVELEVPHPPARRHNFGALFRSFWSRTR